MREVQVKYLETIIGLVCLSGACLSTTLPPVDLQANLTNTTDAINKSNPTTATEAIKTNLTTTTTTTPIPTTIPPVAGNATIVNSSEISQSTESPNQVHPNGTATSHFLDSFDGNDTFNGKMLAMEQSKSPDLGVRETAGFVAIGFLAFSVFGYVGFVLWRRYLQNKYGNSQTLITEDVYDISDLRHFEI